MKLGTFLKRRWLFVIAFTILIAAILLRFYKLGEVPHGFTWDEAAIGYNGFAIWETRRDEWLKFLPISFQSFGDYKAPLAIYLNAIFTALLGLNVFAVRLPFAIFGVLAVVGIGLLTWEVTGLWQNRPKKLLPTAAYPLFAMGLITFSPWHLHFSRAGFESGMALTFVIWGQALVLRYVRLAQKRSTTVWWLLLSSILIAASTYTYHSAKLVVPFLAFGNIFLFANTWKKQAKDLVLASLLFVVLLTPLGLDTFRGDGGQRLHQVSIIGSDKSLATTSKVFLSNLRAHFELDFLVNGKTETLRHGDGKWGVLMPTTLLLSLSALFIVLRLNGRNQSKKRLDHVLVLFFVWWVVSGFVPAALGVDEIPHANRSLLALPAFILLAVMGLKFWEEKLLYSKLNKTVKGNHAEKNIVFKAALGTFILIHLLLAGAYLRHYFSVFAKDSAAAFQDGYLEMFEKIKFYEKGEESHQEVDKIVVTSDYGQPYIYALFVRQTNPIWYQGGSLIKYEFKDVDVGDLMREKALVVASGDDELPSQKAQHLIHGSDGSVRFKIFVTDQVK